MFLLTVYMHMTIIYHTKKRQLKAKNDPILGNGGIEPWPARVIGGAVGQQLTSNASPSITHHPSHHHHHHHHSGRCRIITVGVTFADTAVHELSREGQPQSSIDAIAVLLDRSMISIFFFFGRWVLLCCIRLDV